MNRGPWGLGLYWGSRVIREKETGNYYKVFFRTPTFDNKPTSGIHKALKKTDLILRLTLGTLHWNYARSPGP